MRLRFLSIIASIIVLNVEAQQNSLFNTYSYDLMQLNIATVGRTCLEANLNYRAQWVGVSDSPRLYQLNAGMALGNSNGVGLKLYQQSVGLLKVTNITGAYSYRMKVSKDAKLHFGIGASYNQNRFEVGKVSAADKNDVTLTNAQNNIRSNNFDCETGVLLLSNKLTAGLAIEHLYNTNTEFSASSLNFKPNINVIAAYKIKATENFEVEPWLVTKYTVSGKFQPEILVKGKYADKFSAGLGYRVNYGYLFLMGAELGKIKVAYSFDYGSRSGKAGFGTSHQILLGFDLCRQGTKTPEEETNDNKLASANTSTVATDQSMDSSKVAMNTVEARKDQAPAVTEVPSIPPVTMLEEKTTSTEPAIMSPIKEERISFEGVLKSSENPGDAFKNSKVKILNEKGEVLGETTTNNSGAFAFRDIPGNQNFMVTIDEGNTALPEGTKISLSNLSGKEIKSYYKTKETVNFKILSTEKELLNDVKADDASLAMTINGFLYNQDAKPLANSQLIMHEVNNDKSQKIVTNKNGSFSFANLDADKDYIFEANNNDPTLSGVSMITIADSKGKTIKVIDLTKENFSFKLLDSEKNGLGEFKVEEAILEPIKNDLNKPEALTKLLSDVDLNPIVTRLIFSKNSYTISPTNAEKIKEVAKQINTHFGNVFIIGYASPEGEQQLNLDLAIHRAEVVKKELIKLGVKNNRLKVKNGGLTADLNPNNLEANRTIRFELSE